MSIRSAWSQRAILLVLLAAALLPTRAKADYERDIWPLISKFCADCHGGKKPEAGINFEKFKSHAADARHRKLWHRVREQVAGSIMPPADSPRMSKKQQEKLLDWIDGTAIFVDCSAPVDIGRVTLRRLNRTEYNNTVRDLAGVDFRPADDFPADDVGYGFDNIGDVLSLPPLLLEKYLSAAEAVIDQAIVVPPAPAVAHYEAETEQRDGPGAVYGGFAMVLVSNGEVHVRHVFPETGDYILRVKAFGQQAGKDPARVQLKLDGQAVKTFDVKETEDKPGLFEARLRVKQGGQKFAAAFINDYYQPNDPDPKNRDRNLGIDYLEIEGPFNAGQVILPDHHRRIMIAEPGGGKERAAASKILRRFASRAYRRPAEDEEVERLTEFAMAALDEGQSFEAAIKLPLKAILISPHFLFRVEEDRPPDQPNQSYALNDYELATRLSYFLWSSMPDDELFAAAQGGRLRTIGGMAEQVRRMLRSPKSEALVENFAGQWLQLRTLERLAPDKQQYPDFDEPLREAMIQETQLFFAHIMREDRGLLELLDADYTFVNERLARHYGLAGVRGSEFRQVQLSDRNRGGVLTQASVMTVTSNPTRTSPVKRGKWILENILGTPPPPPPPGAGDLPDGDGTPLAGTLRQRMEQHRQKAACASCHAQMDPLGFGLENFNGIGQWRTEDAGTPIDSSGILPDGAAFAGPAELREVLLRQQGQYLRCLSEKMLTYALGRGLEYDDRCTVDGIVQALADDEQRFSRLILAIVQSDPFLRRRAK
ncbi:MAG: DUF1592 domain-containing protein [Pirellulales bacterium]